MWCLLLLLRDVYVHFPKYSLNVCTVFRKILNKLRSLLVRVAHTIPTSRSYDQSPRVNIRVRVGDGDRENQCRRYVMSEYMGAPEHSDMICTPYNRAFEQNI